MEKPSAADRLKAIRERTGLSLQRLAEAMELKLSTYRHYEERFKGHSLPAEFVEKLLLALADFPEVESDIRGLISIPQHQPQGMAGSGAAFRGQRLADQLYSGTSGPNIAIKIEGGQLQVMATVDRKGITKLIEKLNIARELLD